MRRHFNVLLAVTALLFFPWPASGAVISFFNDGAYVDVAQEADHLHTSLDNIGGHTVNPFTGVSAAAFTTALAGADTLVIPELQNGDLYAGMDGDARTVVRDFVRDGGNIVITSQVTRASALINGLFGKSVTSGSGAASDLNASDSLGTIFEGGPASLTSPSAVQGVATSSLPSFALSIYENAGGGSTVFVFPEDAGSVIYLGFDWYATPTDADWQTVLGLGLLFESNVWDGSDDALWSTDANWTTDSAPGANERLVFAGAANTTVNHDNPAGTEYAAITFASDAAAFTITGNAIGLTDGANITNRSANTQIFTTDIELANANATVTADTARLDFYGDISLGGTSDLTVAGGDDTYMTGTVSGTGSLTVSATGTGGLVLTGENTYTGGTTITDGSLVAFASSLPGDVTNHGALVFAQLDDETWSGTISGTGRVSKLGAASLTLDNANTFTGDLNLAEGTVVLAHENAAGTGDVYVYGATLRGAATLGGDLTVTDGSIQPGGSIGTLTVTDTFTFNGGTWQVEVDNAGNADKIVAGDAVLTSGTVQAAPTERITGAQSYTILETTSGITGDPADLAHTITDTSWLLDFELAIDGNNLLMTVQGAGGTVASAVNPLGSANLNSIADIYDNALANNLGSAQITALQGMTQAQLQQITRQSRPQIQQASNMVVRNQQRTVHSGMTTRQQSMQQAMRHGESMRDAYALADAGPDSPALGAAVRAVDGVDVPPVGVWTPWVRSLNDWGDLDGDEFANGYDWRTHGFDVGMESRIKENVLLGGSFAALWSNLDGDSGSGSADVTTTYANVYASYLTTDWHLDGGLTYGHAWTDTKRPIAGLTAEGDYESDIFGTYIGGGYVFDLGKWEVEPTLYYEYTHVADDGYTESGAGAFNQTIHDNGTDSLRQAVGVRIARRFDLNGRSALRARFSAVWEHEFLDDQVVTNVDLLGGTFTSRGVDVSRNTARLSAGLDWALRPNATLFADYTASINRDWHNHSANVGLRFAF